MAHEKTRRTFESHKCLMAHIVDSASEQHQAEHSLDGFSPRRLSLCEARRADPKVQWLPLPFSHGHSINSCCPSGPVDDPACGRLITIHTRARARAFSNCSMVRSTATTDDLTVTRAPRACEKLDDFPVSKRSWRKQVRETCAN